MTIKKLIQGEPSETKLYQQERDKAFESVRIMVGSNDPHHLVLTHLH